MFHILSVMLLMQQLSTAIGLGAYEIEANIGDNVSLPCFGELLRMRNSTMLQWQRNKGSEQKSVAYDVTGCEEREYPGCVLDVDGTLHLKNLRLIDSGTYFCDKGYDAKYQCRSVPVNLSVVERVINTPPKFTFAASDFKLYGLNGSTAVVSYSIPTCLDDEDGPLHVECTPPPGQLVDINATLVSCSCKDSSNETEATLLRDPGVVDETSGNAHLWAIIGVLVVVVLVLVVVVVILIKRPARIFGGTAIITGDTENGDDQGSEHTTQAQDSSGDDVDGANGSLEKLLSEPALSRAGQDEAGTSSSAVSQPPVPKNEGTPVKDTSAVYPSSVVDGDIEADGDTLETPVKDTSAVFPSSVVDGDIEADGDTLEASSESHEPTLSLDSQKGRDSKKALRDTSDGAINPPPSPPHTSGPPSNLPHTSGPPPNPPHTSGPPPNLPHTSGPPPNRPHTSAAHSFKAEVEKSYLLEFSVVAKEAAHIQICCNREGKPSGIVFGIEMGKLSVYLEDKFAGVTPLKSDETSVFQLHGKNDSIMLFLLEDDGPFPLWTSRDEVREMNRFLALFGSTEDIKIWKMKGLCRC